MRKINVTKSDIKNGKAGSCKKCPVALAVRRAFKSRKQMVRVFGSDIRVGNRAYIAPDNVDEFVIAFDDRRTVAPFSFKLVPF